MRHNAILAAILILTLGGCTTYICGQPFVDCGYAADNQKGDAERDPPSHDRSEPEPSGCGY